MTKITPKFGSKITVISKYVKNWETNKIKGDGNLRGYLINKWRIKQIEPRVGILIGERTISDFIDYLDGKGKKVNYAKCYLVVFSMRENPIYVPIDGILFNEKII
jgi:hypothetical protein